MKQLDAINEVPSQRTYHIVFSTYYRHPMLIEAQHQQAIKNWIAEIAEQKAIKIIEYKVLTDHVHILLDKQPGQLLPQLIQSIKGITTHYFFETYPEMKKESGKGRLWNRGYNETLIKSEQQLRNTIKYIKNNFDKHRSGAPGFIPVGDKR